MFLRTIRLAVFTAVSLLFASLAFAISYCAKPNGIATRDLAFQLTGELRVDLAARFGSKGKYLILAQVPDSLQSRTDFLAIERKETVRQVSKDPSKRELFSKFAKENGTDISPEQVTPEIIQSLLGPATASSDPIGLLYLYSNDLQTLRRFSSDIADTKGLVIEGEPADIEGLLTSGPENKKFFGWWEKNIPRDLDYLVLVGFSPSPAVRNLVPKTTQVLRVASWSYLTNKGLHSFRGLMDVKPEDAAILNLFPTSTSEAITWGMSTAVTAAYIANGKKLQADMKKLGYSVDHPKEAASVADILSYLRNKSGEGKKILIYAETTKVDGDVDFLRLPGQAGGLTAKDLLQLDDSVLQRLLIVSCNSQSLSSKLPLAIVGTIYTDAAANLVRQTFAAPQVENIGDYLQASTLRTTSWLEPIGRVATAIAEQLSPGILEGSLSDGQLKFRPVAYLAEVVRPVPAVATVPSSSKASSNQPPEASPVSQDKRSGILLAFIGIFGAACREGLRWKRLLEQKRANAFLRWPYILLSMALLFAAGGVAYLFSHGIESPGYSVIVAFVGGAGFEKIIKLAAELKIWNPTRAVPMGPTSVKDLETELGSSEILNFLRHGG